MLAECVRPTAASRTAAPAVPRAPSPAAARRAALTLALLAGALLLARDARAGAGATTWHVRPDGSDVACSGRVNAADPGTGASPRACAFKAPQKGADAAGAGDTVLLHAGTYRAQARSVQGLTTILGFDSRGELDSQAHRLTVAAAGDGPVIFDGGGSTDTGAVIWATCFVTLEGIEFRRFTAGASSSFTYGAAGVNVGSAPAGPSNSLVLRSLVVRDATLAHPTGNFAEIAIWCPDCSNETIDACRIESVEPVGIALGNDELNAIDQRGHITNTTILHSRDAHAWAGIFAFHTNVWTVDGVFISETSAMDSTTDLVRVRNSRNWAIVNSVFRRPPRAAVNLLDDVVAGDLNESDVVLNNTVECTQLADQASCPGCPFIGLRLQKTSSTQVRNNILVSCTSAVLLADNCSNTLLGFNDLFDNTGDYDATGLAFGYTLVGSDISSNTIGDAADPLLRKVAPRPDPYYRLQALSPAIDAGDDAHCGTVPADGACDMGAFQADAGSGSAPARPSIVRVDMLTGKSALLHGSAFDDPDSGDHHAASRWQVDTLAGDFSSPVHDSGRTTSDLTTHRVGGLDPTTSYKSRVRYEDGNGNLSAWSDPASDGGDEFTTLAATAIPPRVIDASPAPGAIAVSTAVRPLLTFNVPLEQASVTSATVKLFLRGEAVAQAGGSPAVQGDGSTVLITPANALDPSTKCRIVVVGGDAGVQSREGSVPGKPFASVFTTETALASSSPSAGATGVALDVHPRLVFKASVNAASANTGTVKLRDAASGRSVALASVTTSGAAVTLTPAAALRANHRYLITVAAGSAGLRFADGRQIGKPVKVPFKTGP